MGKKLSEMDEFELVGHWARRIGAALVLVVGFVTSCTPVESGFVGVQKRFGAVKAQPLTEGIHFVAPFWVDSVYAMNTKTQPAAAEASASSKDLQAVHTTVTVQFSVRGPSAPRIFQRFGTSEAFATTVLSPAIQESVKAVTARYTAEQLITKRSEVKLGVERELHEFVEKTLKNRKAEGSLEIANVAITDFDFSREFNASIEAKVKAEQDALKALNEKKKKITQAEADAEEKKLSADAIAYKTKTEAEARAEAIRVEAEALRSQPQLIELRRVERWDGKLPTYNGGGALPMIQVN